MSSEPRVDPPREVEPSSGMKLANSAIYLWRLAGPKLHDEGRLDMDWAHQWKLILQQMEGIAEKADQ